MAAGVAEMQESVYGMRCDDVCSPPGRPQAVSPVMFSVRNLGQPAELRTMLAVIYELTKKRTYNVPSDLLR